MIVGQIDTIISDKLMECKRSGKLNIRGTSNGVIINRNPVSRYLVYLTAILEGDLIQFYLQALCLNVGEQQLMMRVPVYFCTDSFSFEKQQHKHISDVEIELHQSPNNQYLIAFKIRQTKLKQNTTVDILALLVIEPKPFFQNKEPKIPLIKLMVQFKKIVDIKWHPLCPDTFLVLGDNQQIQIWQISEGVSVPTNRISLKKLKKLQNISQQIKIIGMKFLKNLKHEEKFNDCFNLFLFSNQGDIYSLYPLIVNAMALPFNYAKVISLCQSAGGQLINAINSNECRESQNEQTIIYCSQDTENHLISWHFNNEFDFSTQLIRRKEEQHSEVQFYEVHENSIVFQFGRNKINGVSFIKVSLLFGGISMGDEKQPNQFFPVAKVNFSQDNQQFSFRSRLGDNSIVLSYGNSLYALKLTSLINYLTTNNISEIRKSKIFDIDCLLKLNDSESIQSLVFDDESLMIVRSTDKNISFDIRPLHSLGMFDRFEKLTKSSVKILEKLKKLRIPFKNEEDFKAFESVNSLNLNQEKLKKYKKQGLKSFKEEYAVYCGELKNKIDREMNALKITYQTLKGSTKKFEKHGQRKNQLKNMMSTIKQNNKTIQSLLFPINKAKLHDSTETEIKKYEEKVQNIHGLVEFLKEKKTDVKQETETQLIDSSQSLLKRIKSLKDEIKKIEKMEKHLNI